MTSTKIILLFRLNYQILKPFNSRELSSREDIYSIHCCFHQLNLILLVFENLRQSLNIRFRHDFPCIHQKTMIQTSISMLSGALKIFQKKSKQVKCKNQYFISIHSFLSKILEKYIQLYAVLFSQKPLLVNLFLNESIFCLKLKIIFFSTLEIKQKKDLLKM